MPAQPRRAPRRFARRGLRCNLHGCRGRRSFVALNNDEPPFDDPRVRQALNYALDKQLIIDKILNGKATPLAGVLSPDAFGHNPDLPAYGHDPELRRPSTPRARSRTWPRRSPRCSAGSA